MSKFERKVSRSSLGDYIKQEDSTKSNETFSIQQYFNFNWFKLTPMNALFMFFVYLLVALIVEPRFVEYLGVKGSTVICQGLFSSLIITTFFTYKNKTKISLIEFLVHYLIMILVFGIGTLITTAFVY